VENIFLFLDFTHIPTCHISFRICKSVCTYGRGELNRHILISDVPACIMFFFQGSTALMGLGFLNVEDSRSKWDTFTLGISPLDEWSAHRRNLYLTTHDIHKRQTFTPPAGFEPEIPASKRPQAYKAKNCDCQGMKG